MKNTKNVRWCILALAICSAIFGCAKKETITVKAFACAAEEPDREDIYAEVANTDIGKASELMMWALRSDARYKYVELRGKLGAPGILLVVRHTKQPAKMAPNSMN